MARRGRPKHPDVLTPREQEVLELIRANLSNEQIAERLGISFATAKFHVSEIIGKLGVRDRHEAAIWQPPAAGAPSRQPGWLAPLSMLRRVPPLVTPAVSAAILGLVAVAVALLALGVFATRGGRSSGSVDTAAVNTPWTVDTADHGVTSLIMFDLRRHVARRPPARDSLALAQWSEPGATLIGRTGGNRSFGPWHLVNVDGDAIREVAPTTASVDASPDGQHAVVVEAGAARMVDVTSAATSTLREGNVRNARFSLDGQRLAYEFVNGRDQENTVSDFQNVMVAEAGDFTSPNSIQFQRAADGYLMLTPDPWSPDGKYLLLQRELPCANGSASCRRAVAFEVYGTVLSGDRVWHDYEGRLVSAQWAGPGRLYVTFADDAQLDPAFPATHALLVELGIGKHTVPDVIERSCCVSWSPDGQHAVAQVGEGVASQQRCVLFDATNWDELASFDAAPADDNTVFCGVADWTPDGTEVIVSQGGI